MSNRSFNLVILQNATYQLDGQWLSGSDPVDLTGWTLAAQVRKLPTSATILYDLAPTVTNAAEGRWQILIPAEVSRLWAWNSGMWDLRAEAPGAGQAIRLVSGTVTVNPAVTRT